jgi:hypothetical protein
MENDDRVQGEACNAVLQMTRELQAGKFESSYLGQISTKKA